MIIEYDRNKSLTEEQRLQSLIDSIQRALDELTIRIDQLEKKVEKGANNG